MNSLGNLTQMTPISDIVVFDGDDSIYIVWGWFRKMSAIPNRFFSGFLVIGSNKAISDRDEGHLIMLGVLNEGRQASQGFIWNFDSQARSGTDLFFDHNYGESLTDAAQKKRPQPTTYRLKVNGSFDPEGLSQYQGSSDRGEKITLFLQKASVGQAEGFVGALAIT